MNKMIERSEEMVRRVDCCDGKEKVGRYSGGKTMR